MSSANMFAVLLTMSGRSFMKMTNKIQKKIKRRAEDIEDRFADGDAVQALQAYSKISGQCMKCHINLRKW